MTRGTTPSPAFGNLRQFAIGIRDALVGEQAVAVAVNPSVQPAQQSADRFVRAVYATFPTIAPGSQAELSLRAMRDNARSYEEGPAADEILSRGERHMRQWFERMTALEQKTQNMPPAQKAKFEQAWRALDGHMEAMSHLRQHHVAITARAQRLAQQMPVPARREAPSRRMAMAI